MKYLSLVSAVAVFSSTGIQAESIEQALTKCSNVNDSLQRLVCFDTVAKGVKQYSGRDHVLDSRGKVDVEAPRPAPRQPLDAAQSNATATSFGLENKHAREEISEITSTVTAIDEAPRGELIITLSDGAIWRQKDSGRYVLRVGDEVTIERGMMGAFYLSKPEQNKRIRVKRTK